MVIGLSKRFITLLKALVKYKIINYWDLFLYIVISVQDIIKSFERLVHYLKCVKCFSFLYTKHNKVGNTIKSKGMAIKKPPITAIARG